MTDTITLTGVVATPPRSLQTASGLSITSFRLASSQRRYDRTKGEWIDADTNWYTVTAFRQLADNLTASLAKGERVVVSGRLRIRDWENGERSGTAVEVDADAVGHDLQWGTTTFTRVARHAASETQPAQDPVHETSENGTSQPSPAPGFGQMVASAGGAPVPAAPNGSPSEEGAVAAASWGAGFASGLGDVARGAVPASTPVSAAPASGAAPGASSAAPAPVAAEPAVEQWHSGDTEAPF